MGSPRAALNEDLDLWCLPGRDRVSVPPAVGPLSARPETLNHTCPEHCWQGQVLMGALGASRGCRGLRNQHQAALMCCWPARVRRLLGYQVSGVHLGVQLLLCTKASSQASRWGLKVHSCSTCKLCAPRAMCPEKQTGVHACVFTQSY